jgi:hypothetical protein
LFQMGTRFNKVSLLWTFKTKFIILVNNQAIFNIGTWSNQVPLYYLGSSAPLSSLLRISTQHRAEHTYAGIYPEVRPSLKCLPSPHWS